LDRRQGFRHQSKDERLRQLRSRIHRQRWWQLGGRLEIRHTVQVFPACHQPALQHTAEVGMLEEPINVFLRLELKVEGAHTGTEEQQAISAQVAERHALSESQFGRADR
jgi:hypothetical protein